MSRPLRIEFAYGLYHVTSRGDRREDIFMEEADRDEAIVQAYASGGYAMKEIGDYFGLHYSRVSRLIARIALL